MGVSKSLCFLLGRKLPIAGIGIVSALAAFLPSGAFAQCILNGASDPSCTLTGPLVINNYSDGAGTTTTANGTFTFSSPGTMDLQSVFRQTGDVTLTGTGTVTMSGAQFGTDGNGRTLNNGIDILGFGTIGSNAGPISPNLSLNNSGLINANSSGNTLTLSESGSTTNTGTLEASGSGTLLLASGTINNNGGIILADGGTVTVNTTIQGGTLTTSNSGTLQTGSGGATLDGSSQGAITLSDGSTYTAGANTITTANGTLNLGTTTGSTLSLAGSLRLNGNLGLGIATGTISMINGQIGTDSNGRTLTNAGIIEGTGTIGSNGTGVSPNLSFINSGTVNANTSGTLTIGTNSGSVSNTGTFEATNGGTLTLASVPINNNGGVIASSGSGSTVNVNVDIQGGTLTTSGGGIIQTSSTATLDGSAQGAITLSDGSTYTAGANTITTVNGTLNLGTTTGSTLSLAGSLRLNGDLGLGITTGTISMNNGQIGTDGNGRTLTNAGIIEGTGTIGSNGTGVSPNLTFNNSGTVNANTAGTLTIGTNSGSVSNTGTFEATNGGTLTLASVPINNHGGVIASSGSGSTVNVNVDIQGGTLTTSGGGILQTSGTATLDGSTQGAITLSDGTQYTAGANTITSILGSVVLGASNSTTALVLSGSLKMVGDVTFSGPGSVTLSGLPNGGQIGTDGNGRTLNNETLIQGFGTVGSNGTGVSPNVSLNNTSTGIINANSGGSTLTISNNGGTTNAGLFEATGGGILTLSGSAINNNGGNITASGTGSTVNVQTEIQGGTLNTSDGGVMQSVGTNNAFLNGNTGNGAITISDGSAYTAGSTTQTEIAGSIILGTSTGSTLALGGNLRMQSDLTLSGPGSVVMTGGQIGTDGNGRTLNNEALIQGFGTIGSNVTGVSANVGLNNTGTVNANSSGNVLTLANNNGTTNTNLLEASGGGILTLASSPIVNTNGNITASGTGSIVNVETEILNGTLNTNGGGVMQSVGINNASLNGTITISDGSTYTAASGTQTNIAATLNLGTSTGGTLALGGNLRMVGDVTLSGPGSVTMSNGQIGTDGNGRNLTNNATILGFGVIGSGVSGLSSNMSVNNTSTGAIIANGTGNTMNISGGTLTNAGTLQANAGSTLLATDGLSGTTFSSATLQTGTYNAFAGGTIQLNGLGSTGGEIVNNAATILLSGVGSALVDGAGLNALSNFSNNLGSGVFTINDGRDFTSLSPFSNQGIVDIGMTSTFFVGASGDGVYTQTSGTTDDDGTLDPLATNINGGLLDGNGTVDGNLTADLGGTVTPGDGGAAGVLTVDDNYIQTAAGNLDIAIGGTTEGLNGYSYLDVLGDASVGGTLALSSINGFDPTAGDTFFVVQSAGDSGEFGSVTWANLTVGLNFTTVYNADNVEIEVEGTVSPTPEPATWLLFAAGLGAIIAIRAARKRNPATPSV